MHDLLQKSGKRICGRRHHAFGAIRDKVPIPRGRPARMSSCFTTRARRRKSFSTLTCPLRRVN
jgi:hypothetical protein